MIWRRLVAAVGSTPFAAVAARTRCCGDPEGCVLCEVDGTPLSAEQLARRQQMDAEGRARLDAFVASQQLPASSAVAVVIAGKLTARERGRLRREQLDELDRRQGKPFRMPGRMGAGMRDRRHTRARSG